MDEQNIPILSYRYEERMLDGVTYYGYIPVRILNGIEVTISEDWQKFNMQIACRLSELRHRGKEGLRFIRKTLGLTLIQIAEIFGVDELTVREWESGKIIPNNAIIAVYYLMVNNTINGKGPLECFGNEMVVFGDRVGI